MADLVGEVIGKIVTFLGYDGTWFRPVHVDAAGDLQVDVLGSALPAGAATAANQALILAEVAEHTPLDRNPTDRTSCGDVAYGLHVLTLRHTYTVGAGKKALLMNLFARTAVPGAGVTTQIRIYVNDCYVMWMENTNAATVHDNMKESPCNIWLDAGDTVKVSTANTGAANVWFQWSIHVIEFT